MYGLHYHDGTEHLKPSMLLLHGFPGGYGDVLGIGEAIAPTGINVFVLTLSGISISEGVYGGDSPIRDLNAALDYFFDPDQIKTLQIDTSDFIIGGWSFGGALSMYMGAHDARIKRIISIAGFNGDAFLAQCEEQPDFRKLMEALFISYRMRKIIDFDPLDAIDDLEANRTKFTPVDFADNLAEKPILLFGATDDAEVSLVRHIMPYYQAIRKRRGDITFKVYQAGHRFVNKREEIHQDVISWIKNK